MNTFFDIAGYEFKKVLCRKRTVIVLVLVILVSAVSVFGTIIGSDYYIDENGNEITFSRYEEEMIDRRYAEELSGRVIDADLIMEAVEAYRQVPLNGSTRYIDITAYQNIARKYSEVYRIVCRFMNLNGIEDFRVLTRERAEQFDAERISYLSTFEDHATASEKSREYCQKCIEQLPERLTYEYSGGYYRFATIMYTTAIMAGAAIAILFSGIFSNEYTSGADSLILSSKHGKGLVIGAKLFVAFVFSAALILLLIAITYAETMIVWGSSGADSDLTLITNTFPYPLTLGQSVGLYILCVTMACLLFAAVTSLFSAVFKAPFNTIIIMSLLLIVPMFIAVPDGSPVWVYCLENLLPTNMMAFWGALYDYQYELFGLVIPPYVFLPIFALVVTLVCTFFTYRGFKKHQVN